MQIKTEDLRTGLEKLENLAGEEYGKSLTELLSDPDHDESDRLWRFGRLVGIALKEPFAHPEPEDSGRSVTGARRAWILDDASFELPANQEKWQYRTFETLVRDDDLRSQAYLGPSVLDLAEYIAQDLRTTGTYRDLGALAGLIQGSLGTGTDTATSVAKRILEDYPAPNSLVLANF